MSIATMHGMKQEELIQKTYSIRFAPSEKHNKKVNGSIQEIQIVKNDVGKPIFYACTQDTHLYQGDYALDQPKLFFTYTGIDNVTHLGNGIQTIEQSNQKGGQPLASFLPITSKGFFKNSVSLININAPKITKPLYKHNTDILSMYAMSTEHGGETIDNIVVTGSRYPSITIFKQTLSPYIPKNEDEEPLSTIKTSTEEEYEEWEAEKPIIKTFPGYFLLAVDDNYILYGIQNDLFPKKENAIARWFHSKRKKTAELSTIYKIQLLNNNANLTDLRSQETFATEISIDLNTLTPGAVSASTAFFINSEGIPQAIYTDKNTKKNITTTILNGTKRIKNIVGKPYIVSYNNLDHVIFFKQSSFCFLTINEYKLNTLNIVEYPIENNESIKAHTYDQDSKIFHVVVEDTLKTQKLIVLPLTSIIK